MNFRDLAEAGRLKLYTTGCKSTSLALVAPMRHVALRILIDLLLWEIQQIGKQPRAILSRSFRFGEASNDRFFARKTKAFWQDKQLHFRIAPAKRRYLAIGSDFFSCHPEAYTKFRCAANWAHQGCVCVRTMQVIAGVQPCNDEKL